MIETQEFFFVVALVHAVVVSTLVINEQWPVAGFFGVWFGFWVAIWVVSEMRRAAK